MIRPTRRAALWFAGLLPLPWLLLAFRPDLWQVSFVLSALFLLALAMDAVLARPRRVVQVKLHAPETAFVGEMVPAEVSVEAPRGLPAGYELVLDVGGDSQPRVLDEAAGSGRSGNKHTFLIQVARRGLLQVETVWLRWRGPWRLMESTRRFEIGAKTAIVPNRRMGRGEDLELVFEDALAGLKVQRGSGEGAEFEALREYVPGHDSRFIDWKRSARHRKIQVREFRVERNHPVVLAFDTGYLMREPVDGVPRLDHALSAGLVLARLAIKAEDLVGVYSFDSRPRQFLPPGRGLATFRRLQQASAAIAYSHDETNFTLGLGELQTRLARRSLIVLFTDFVDTITAELLLENVRRLTARHVVLFVTLRDRALEDTFGAWPGNTRQIAQAVLADELLRERRVVREKLERLGIHCIESSPEGLSPAVLNRYLLIKQRGFL